MRLTREQKIAVLTHREDEAIRDMEVAYGSKLSKVARSAKLRWQRAFRTRQNIEAGYNINIAVRGLSEQMEVQRVAKRTVAEIEFANSILFEQRN